MSKRTSRDFGYYCKKHDCDFGMEGCPDCLDEWIQCQVDSKLNYIASEYEN